MDEDKLLKYVFGGGSGDQESCCKGLFYTALGSRVGGAAQLIMNGFGLLEKRGSGFPC